jgi:UDP-glucose 4-epimerase
MDLKNKSILVTGGAGFIGSHLVDALINENPKDIVVVDDMFLGKESNLEEAKENFANLILYKGDTGNFEVMQRILEKHKTDVIFNLAVIPLPASLEMPKQSTDKNIETVTTVCELQRLGFFKTLIHFSSSEAYGSAQYEHMDEKHPLGPSTPYAASKAAGDLIVLSYYRTFNTDCAIIRPFNNYGPRQNEETYAGVIPLTIKRILNDEAPVIYGDGRQTRDYIYVTETARMAIEIYKNERTRGKVINIGSGGETSILTVVKQIMKLLNCDKEIKFEPTRPADVRRHIANIYLAEDILGFKQEIDFEKGMKMTVDWYLKNMKTGKDD